MVRKLYQELASCIIARANCIRMNNGEWENKHTDRINKLVADHMPSGSGIDNGTKIDIDASGEKKIVFTAGFHHMNDNGYYDGWTEHTITITPSFDGFDIKVSGRDRNDIKDYLGEVYYHALTSETF